MNRDFLAFIWQHRLFENETLHTTCGQKLALLSTGFADAKNELGFNNARILLNGAPLAGRVLLYEPKGEDAPSKENKMALADDVILLLTYNDGSTSFLPPKTDVPCFAMQISKAHIDNYQRLMQSPETIACHSGLKGFPSIKLSFWLDSLLLERLMLKTKPIEQVLARTANDWNELFYRFLARAFGFGANAEALEQLAALLPLRVLARHRANLFQLEALLFGCAGLLNSELDVPDLYHQKLRKEFLFLQAKYKLQVLEPDMWRFAGLRPQNYPSIRLAQFAYLLHSSQALFSKLIALEDLKKMRELLQCEVSEYWLTHYNFGKESTKRQKPLGKASINGLLINTIIPILFVYAEAKHKVELKDRALGFLEQLPAERNSIITQWQEAGLKVKSAFQSQALLQLHKTYCQKKACLHCTIGTSVLQGECEVK